MSAHALIPDFGPAHSRARDLELQMLEQEIATLSAHLDAATWRLLELIREFDQKHGWANGFQSCAHWLNWRVGLSMVAAREKVRVAHALVELPRVSEAFRKGLLSYSKVRAITRVATPELEADLLAMARAGTTHHIEKVVRLYRQASRIEANRLAMKRHDDRYLQTFTDSDGSFVIKARLSPEVGAVVAKALDAAYAELRKDECAGTGKRRGDDSAESSESSPADIAPAWRARRADALGIMAEAALRAGFDQRPGAERVLITVHIDQEVLADPDADGRSNMDGGLALSPDSARRLACDASIVEMVHGADGGVLDVGRKTRIIPTRLRRALRERDAGCRFPGCCRSRYLEAHHLKHWADGGETNLDNLIQLCWYHHHALHEGGMTIEGHAGGETVFRHPGGWIIPFVHDPVKLGSEPVSDLMEQNRATGVEVNARDNVPSWDGRPIRYDLSVSPLFNHGPRGRVSEPVLNEAIGIAPVASAPPANDSAESFPPLPEPDGPLGDEDPLQRMLREQQERASRR